MSTQCEKYSRHLHSPFRTNIIIFFSLCVNTIKLVIVTFTIIVVIVIIIITTIETIRSACLQEHFHRIRVAVCNGIVQGITVCLITSPYIGSRLKKQTNNVNRIIVRTVVNRTQQWCSHDIGVNVSIMHRCVNQRRITA